MAADIVDYSAVSKKLKLILGTDPKSCSVKELKDAIREYNDNPIDQRTLLMSGKKEELIKRINKPKIVDFKRRNQQIDLLDYISKHLLDSKKEVLYLVNSDEKEKEEQDNWDGEVVSLPKMAKEAGVHIGNIFDVTHIDSRSKISPLMEKNNLGIIRVGDGVAVMIKGYLDHLYHDFEEFNESECQTINFDLPKLFRLSQPNNPKTLSEALICDIAHYAGIMNWVHTDSISNEINIIRMSPHRTNQTFKFKIKELQLDVTNLQIETDSSTQVESDPRNQGISESKSESNSKGRKDFAVYQIYNPFRKNIIRSKDMKGEIDQKAVFLVGKVLDMESQKFQIDAYVYTFSDENDMSSIELVKKQRFTISPCSDDEDEKIGDATDIEREEIDNMVDKIHHLDSLDGMKKLPSESIDLVITSPPYADMKVYADGFAGFHPDKYVEWFLPYASEISRILKPTGSFVLNINDKSKDGFRHPFVFELIYAIHNIVDYCKMKNLPQIEMNGLKLFERLFWNKGKYLAHPKRFGDKIEFLFWFSKSKDRKFNIDPMRLEYDEKSVKRMKRPLMKRFVRESGEEVVEYKQGGEGSWAPNEKGALPSVLIEEGAMLHVREVIEELPEGTVLFVERLDSENFEVVQPKVGDSPHPSTVVTIGSETRRIAENHVAVYPERLVNYFIQGSTDEGDIVLDPFIGTGTTAVVANALGRKYIGFDINEKYVKFANERVETGPYLRELIDEKKKRDGGSYSPRLDEF